MSTNVCLRLLRHETGLLKSMKLRNEICWNRTRAIELCRFRDVCINQENDSNEEDDDTETDPRGHSAAITALDLDGQDGRYLLAGGADGSLYIHDLANFSGEPRFSSKLVSQIKSIPAPQVPAPQPRGSQSSRRRPERTQPEDRNGHFQSVQTVQWFPGDSAIFVTSGMDQRLLVWDANSVTIAEEFNINKLVFCHQLSQPPSTLVAVASASNHLRLIDLKSGSSTHELRGHTGNYKPIEKIPNCICPIFISTDNSQHHAFFL
jgi:WD40 repeat protein